MDFEHDDLSAELRATCGLLAVVTTQFRDDVAAMIADQTQALSERFGAVDDLVRSQEDLVRSQEGLVTSQEGLVRSQEEIRAELAGHRDLLVRIAAHLSGDE